MRNKILLALFIFLFPRFGFAVPPIELTGAHMVSNPTGVLKSTSGTFAANATTSDLGEGSNLYFSNARSIDSTLTGFASGAGTVSATDSILSAIQKIVGNLALKFGSVTYTASAPSRSLNSNFTPSTTLGVYACHSVKISCSFSLGGSCEGLVELRSDSNTTPTTSRGENQMALSGTLVLGVTLTNSQTGQVCHLVPPNHNVRIVTTTVSGSPTFTLTRASETSIGFGS